MSFASRFGRLKNRKNPKILLLGFSTVYSLENLAALIHLSNLDNPKIIDFDINKQPLSEANVYCGTKLYNVEIEYEQGNAILSEFFEADSFDLIATHLFLTHIPDESKIRCKCGSKNCVGYITDQANWINLRKKLRWQKKKKLRKD